MKPRRLSLHVDELVLHGFAGADRHRIGMAAERELTRLLAERGVPGSPRRGREMASIDAGTVALPPGASPWIVGAAIARAVYRGLEP